MENLDILSMGCSLACFRNNDDEIVVESSGQEPPVVVAPVGDAHKKVGREQGRTAVAMIGSRIMV